VNLSVSGSYNGNLYAYLVAPNGTLVLLLNRPGSWSGNPVSFAAGSPPRSDTETIMGRSFPQDIITDHVQCDKWIRENWGAFGAAEAGLDGENDNYISYYIETANAAPIAFLKSGETVA